MANLEELIRLLDYPDLLEKKISQLELNESNSDEVDGFIILYNNFKGDTKLFKKYLAESKEKITGTNKKNSISFHWTKFAAISLLILGIGSYIKLQTNTTNYYKTYVDTDPGLPVFMSINTNKLDKWMLEYKEKNYSKALQTGLNLLNENPNNDTICYYLGVIYLELNHPQKANKIFSKFSSKESIFSEKAHWLSAICWMSLDKEKAKKEMANIQNENGFYSVKAKEILTEEF